MAISCALDSSQLPGVLEKRKHCRPKKGNTNIRRTKAIELALCEEQHWRVLEQKWTKTLRNLTCAAEPQTIKLPQWCTNTTSRGVRPTFLKRNVSLHTRHQDLHQQQRTWQATDTPTVSQPHISIHQSCFCSAANKYFKKQQGLEAVGVGSALQHQMLSPWRIKTIPVTTLMLQLWSRYPAHASH